MRRWRMAVALGALAFGAVGPGRAQAPPACGCLGPPDVLILVYQQPGQADLVDITYAHTVPHAQAAARPGARWPRRPAGPIGPSRVTDGAPPVRTARSAR